MTDATITLSERDYVVFGLDLSGSMLTADAPEGATRIAYAKRRIADVLERSAGVDVIGFGTVVLAPPLPLKSAEAPAFLAGLHADHGNTHTHELFLAAHTRRMAATAPRSGTLVVITDGTPTPDVSLLAALDKALSVMDVYMLTVGEGLDVGALATWCEMIRDRGGEQLRVGRLETAVFEYEDRARAASERGPAAAAYHAPPLEVLGPDAAHHVAKVAEHKAQLAAPRVDGELNPDLVPEERRAARKDPPPPPPQAGKRKRGH